MKQAQVKMTESIGVLIVFFFLIVIGLTFYTQFQTRAIQEKNQENIMQRAIQIAQITSKLPELQCSFGTEQEVVVKSACLDLLKLQSAKDLFEDNSIYYYDVLYYSNISVEIIYPTPPSLDPDIQNLIDEPIYENTPEEYTSKIRTYFPVLLRDVVTDSPNSLFYFGILTVDTYSK